MVNDVHPMHKSKGSLLDGAQINNNHDILGKEAEDFGDSKSSAGPASSSTSSINKNYVYTRRKSSLARWLRGMTVGSNYRAGATSEERMVFTESDILAEGWLYKVSRRKDVKKRYFILRTDTWNLCYYKSNTELILLGEFPLNSTDAVVDTSLSRRPYGIDIQQEDSSKTISLIAENSRTQKLWLTALRMAVRREKDVEEPLISERHVPISNSGQGPSSSRSAKKDPMSRQQSGQSNQAEEYQTASKSSSVQPADISHSSASGKKLRAYGETRSFPESVDEESGGDDETDEETDSSHVVPRRTGARSTPSHSTNTHSFTASGQTFILDSKYQMIKPVGTGAYGVVIAAKNDETEEKVAVKKIPRLFEDLIDAKRILREVKLLRHLRHPNIISLMDLPPPPSYNKFEDMYIITDLMETDLYQVIYSRQPLSNEHVQFFLYQILCALKYMHSAEILHRDLKPSNILLNANCDLKICDFGLARGITPEDDGKQKSLTEYVVTRWYRAPEIMLSCPTYTKSIDMWSVGCIFAEMLTREPLFPGNDYIHQLKLILKCLGTQCESDLQFVNNPKARRFLTSQAIARGMNFAEMIPNAQPEAIDLLKKMLIFNPHKRISVEDALAHPYLSSLHDPTDEPVAETAFDFDWEIPDDKLTKQALRRQLYEEVRHFHPDLPTADSCEDNSIFTL